MKISSILSIPSFSSMKAGIGSVGSNLSQIFSTKVCPYLPSARSVTGFITSYPVMGVGVFVIVGFVAYRYRKEIGAKISSLWKKCFQKSMPSYETSASVATRAMQEMEDFGARTTKAAEQARELVRRRVAAAAGTEHPPSSSNSRETSR